MITITSLKILAMHPILRFLQNCANGEFGILGYALAILGIAGLIYLMFFKK